MAFPTLSETQISILVHIEEDIYVGDYGGPKTDIIISHARTVCNIFEWRNIQNDASRFRIQQTHILKDPNTFSSCDINCWFSLGVVFQYANSYFASIKQQSMGFLRYAVMCLNCGNGWKLWEYPPKQKEWEICQSNDPQCYAICITVGEDILKKALRKIELNEPESTTSEKMFFATHYPELWKMNE